MTTPEADEPARTARIETPGQQPSPPPLESPSAESEPSPFQDGETLETPAPEPAATSVSTRGLDATTQIPAVASAPAAPTVPTAPVAASVATAPSTAAFAERDVTFVPLAVTIGDGFKFGCGFFLAMVLALLVGFVVVAALFVITGLLGVALPIGR